MPKDVEPWDPKSVQKRIAATEDDGKQYAPACDRNSEVILKELLEIFPKTGSTANLINVRNDLKCDQLFNEYSRSLAI